jgi:hypothetical protein
MKLDLLEIAMPQFKIRTAFLLTLLALSQSALSQSAPEQKPAAAPQTARISTAVMLGQVDHKTMPVYPEEAMKKGIQGDVTFKVAVDETGKLTAATPADGDPLLIAAGTDSLRTFHFRPFMFDGTPVNVESLLGFHFTLQKTDDAIDGHVECMTSIPKRP